MTWLKRTLDSSIGGKFVVAVTGLAMVLFLVVHLAGNLLVFKGPEAMTEYAQGLRKLGALLWVARGGLIVVSVLHVSLAISLNLRNQAARPVAYAKKQFQKASSASRSMIPTGLILLAYIVFHLADFTWRLTRADYRNLGDWDVYRMVVVGLSNPLHGGIYIVAMVAMGIHLSHGISSVFQTLGLKHPKYDLVVHYAGPLLGGLLAAGFISIPVSILLGIIS